jgi:hypothetical protein
LGSLEAEFCRFFSQRGGELWQPDRRSTSKQASVGKLREDLEAELWIWRPILARKVSLTEVKSGVCSVDDLMRLNALLDMSDAYQDAAMAKKD